MPSGAKLVFLINSFTFTLSFSMSLCFGTTVLMSGNFFFFFLNVEKRKHMGGWFYLQGLFEYL